MDVRVPDLGDFENVPVIEILVAPGEEVAAEDPLVTLESDKATMDVPSPAAGTVGELKVKVGDRVSKDTLLLTLESVETSAPDQGSAPGEDTDQTPHASPSLPSSSSPEGHNEPPAASSKKPEAQLVVLGAGPGGYTAAFRAADLGLKVTLVERHERLGGVCLNVGCIPSKALLHAARTLAEAQEMAEHGIAFGKPKVDLESLLTWKQGVVTRLTDGLTGLAKRRNVEIVRGEAQLTGPHSLNVADREITFDNLIIAAGSEAVKLPFMPDDRRVIDSTGALSPDSVPKRLLVVGGGIIGLEMATVYDALGARVTVVEMLDQIIPGADPDVVKPLHKRIDARYEKLLLKTQVLDVTAQKSGLKVGFSSGDTETYDRILVAVGRSPNGHRIGAEAAGIQVDERGFIGVDAQLRTNVAHIHAIGDIVGGPMLAHKASHEAKVAAEVIAGDTAAAFDPRSIPSVAYTDPEVAWAGLTETAAKADGIPYEKQTFPWAASGRALGLGRPEGLTKLLFETETGRLLGGAITGVGAGDLIAEVVHALEMGSDAEDLALTIHPHPTLSETVGFAAELQDGSITDLMPPRRARPSAAAR